MDFKEIIDQMTLEEKASLTSGKNFWETQDIERLHIPKIFMSDGPHGLRKQGEAADHLGFNPSIAATCFPTAATIANSWNEELAEEIGQALGQEALSLDVQVVLGPGINMKRNPLCGRNFEYFSEDPYLAGKLAAGYIRGIQSKNVTSCVKHFAVNNQELRRMVIDTVVDERTLREIYLTAFEIAVKEGKSKMIMTSYNMLNGLHTNENPHLLKDILRGEWGFDGVVVTDWGGNNDRVSGLKCGNEIEMPGNLGETDKEIVAAVKKGELDEKILDTSVERILKLVFNSVHNETKETTIKDHHQLAQRAEEESIVLLKNQDDILPLKKGTKVAVIGDFAFKPRYQGAGSSVVNPTKLDRAIDLITSTHLVLDGQSRGYKRFGKKDEKLLQEAVNVAKQAEVVLLYLGLDETSEVEGLDRSQMEIPENQQLLLEEIYAVNKNIIVILSCGSTIEMPWIGQVKGIVHGCLCGQAGAKPILDVLCGTINPCGKLAETCPMAYLHTPSASHFPGKEKSVEYREGIFMGYRYFTTANIAVRFPFGFGLSYTTFSYSNLIASEDKVVFMLENTGESAGAEVAQLYVSPQTNGVFRALRELKGFKKVFLQPGEKQEVTITLDDKAYRYFNVNTNKWEIEAGVYQLEIGASCTDIKLSAQIEIEGKQTTNPYNQQVLPSYYSGKAANVSKEEFEILLGHKVPESKWDKSKLLGYNDTISQMFYAKSLTARFVYKLLRLFYWYAKKRGKHTIVNLFDMVVFNQPFRGIARMTGGLLSMEMVDGILTIVNGHLFQGTKHLVRANSKRKRLVKEIKANQ